MSIARCVSIKGIYQMESIIVCMGSHYVIVILGLDRFSARVIFLSARVIFLIDHMHGVDISALCLLRFGLL